MTAKTKKEIDIKKMMPMIQDKRVKILTNGLVERKATVTGFTGLYLLLKDVEFVDWDAAPNKREEMICVKWIKSINFV